MTQISDIDTVRDYLTGLQDRICAAIETADGGARFTEDRWQRTEGGGGRADSEGHGVQGATGRCPTGKHLAIRD